MKVLFVFNLVMGSFCTILVVGSIVNKFSNNKWFCNFWGWHKEPKNISNIGRNGFVCFKGKCPRCGKEVMQDSQGNWF